MEASPSVHREAEMSGSGGKRGGWIIFLFIIGTVMCLTLAAGGWQPNLIVYLIREYNVKSIDAAQISNVVSGCSSLFPVIGEIIALFLGLLPRHLHLFWEYMVLFTLTATLDSLRPPACENVSISCGTPSKIQFAGLQLGRCPLYYSNNGSKPIR